MTKAQAIQHIDKKVRFLISKMAVSSFEKHVQRTAWEAEFDRIKAALAAKTKDDV